MKHYTFDLRLSQEAYLDYYRGAVTAVIATTREGQRVQFPASLLVKFVMNGGISGTFVLVCDDNNKCIELKKLG